MSQEELTSKQPVAPIDRTKDLKCPLLAPFGREDQAPTLAQVDQHENELKEYRKTYASYWYPNGVFRPRTHGSVRGSRPLHHRGLTPRAGNDTGRPLLHAYSLPLPAC